jgi:hypothetical protein
LSYQSIEVIVSKKFAQVALQAGDSCVAVGPLTLDAETVDLLAFGERSRLPEAMRVISTGIAGAADEGELMNRIKL